MVLVRPRLWILMAMLVSLDAGVRATEVFDICETTNHTLGVKEELHALAQKYSIIGLLVDTEEHTGNLATKLLDHHQPFYSVERFCARHSSDEDKRVALRHALTSLEILETIAT
jgi:hypothetical protein